ncbi:TetR/AcrR family transcriptional regulator [Salibacterium halotolerans]|uniref:DNA-binding transcriptional regulator, AcrR family n=1 Tax=Salibacterium halotolerans TaxID=1884432 RepID=A0A1I5U6S3_9BACI|nr:TetR/AcrR family transcriptional regulator [Salibacterium halotolerans]SFP90981.1 DNA-binding transcriptional regulator, AcrR family [Salibacterium halotolerans]
MEKRQQILEGASKVISERGLHRLTLDAVAKECNMSKAGLIHHFPSKEALITAMNKQVADRFTESIDQANDQEPSYNKAYLKGSIEELNAPKMLNVSNSLLAAIATNPELIQPWRQSYEEMDEKMKQEGISEELSSIIRLVSDGLWFANMFDLQPLSKQEQENVKAWLSACVDREKRN